jgi:acyl-CoA reductase-like NAD-dependent aldehyde dehydrogenase
MRVRDEQEALRLANDSAYGLQASVFTRDVDRGHAVARRLEAGAVCINDAMMNFTVFGAPMGGWKQSGIGSRHGPGGIRKFCREQTVLAAGRLPRKDPHMYPYRSGRTKMMGRLLALLYRGR